MIQNIIDVVTRPDALFQEKSKSEEDLKTPFLFVAVVGIISALYGYMVGSLTSRMFASAGAGMSEIVAVSSVIGALHRCDAILVNRVSSFLPYFDGLQRYRGF